MSPVLQPVTIVATLQRTSPAWLPLAMAFVPRGMIGIRVAGLLFFLHPDLPFAAASLVRGVLVYGTLWGLVGVAVQLPFTWGRPDLAGRVLPWAIVVVLAASALIDWLHASHLSYYMPPGINTRLIKAGVGLSVTALIGFYTALLHSMHKRAYGIRSRLLMAGLVLASVWVMVERREAFKPQVELLPRQAQVEKQLRPMLWTIGLGGATLDAVLPLVQQGRLPFLANLLESGAHGRLASYAPRRTASLWTSLSTGKLPYRHGVLDDRTYTVPFIAPGGALRLAPVGDSITHWGLLGAPTRRVDASSSEVLAAWEVLDRLGVSCGLIGWPVTHPAPGEAGFAFSDRFFYGDFRRASAHPKELAERGTLFRPDIDAIDPTQVLGPETDMSPAVRLALEQDLWRESLATFLSDRDPAVRAIFLYLPGLELISRAYLGAYHAVQFEGSQDPEMQVAASYLIRYYEHIDRFLADLTGRIPEPRVVALVSAHGYEAPRGWLTLPGRLMRKDAWRGSSADAPDGMLILTGRGIEAGKFLSAAELADVLPTLLYALGLPIARDLDGRVLTEAFSSGFLARQPLTFVPSYETLDEAVDPTPLEAAIAAGPLGPRR